MLTSRPMAVETLAKPRTLASCWINPSSFARPQSETAEETVDRAAAHVLTAEPVLKCDRCNVRVG